MPFCLHSPIWPLVTVVHEDVSNDTWFHFLSTLPDSCAFHSISVTYGSSVHFSLFLNTCVVASKKNVSISSSFSSNTFRYASGFQPSPHESNISTVYSPGSRQNVFEYCMYATRRPELNTS